jgi:hypothetical protein
MMSERRSNIARFFLPVFLRIAALLLLLLLFIVVVGIVVFKSNV